MEKIRGKIMDKIKSFIFCVVLFGFGFQSGFIFKCYWDYKHAPVPTMTAADMYNIHNDQAGRDALPNVE
jgi:hypothetical protein